MRARRSAHLRGVLPAVAAMLAGCGAAAPAPAPPVVATAATAEEWSCTGNLVPPTGWQQETAFVDAGRSGAREQAGVEATSKLVARLCSIAAGSGCEYLTAHARLWKTGSNGKEVCAMATIRSDELAEWRQLAASLVTLDDKLGAAVAELLRGVAPGKRVAVDQVVDLGVPGGERADWLRGRIERLLGHASKLVDVPKQWAGEGVPAGVDVVVRGTVVSRLEQGVPTLESLWSARFPDGRHVQSMPVTFPEHAAPRAPREMAPTVPTSAGLSVRLDGARGGSLCAGERTQIWLESDAPVFVRVFDLYGAGEALLTYPTTDQPSVKVGAGKSIALGGPLGFQAVPVAGFESERFLVVASPTEQGLGRFGAAHGECRVPAELARQLTAGGGIPAGAKVATTGYRITTGPLCPVVEAPRAGEVESLAQLPACQL